MVWLSIFETKTPLLSHSGMKLLPVALHHWRYVDHNWLWLSTTFFHGQYGSPEALKRLKQKGAAKYIIPRELVTSTGDWRGTGGTVSYGRVDDAKTQ